MLADDPDRDIVYLGDLDKAGADIERNTLAVLEDASPEWTGDWQRIALTDDKVAERDLVPVFKRDGRDGRVRPAWERWATCCAPNWTPGCPSR